MKSNEFVITLRGTICIVESVDDSGEYPQVRLRALHRNYHDHATVNSVIVTPVAFVAYLHPGSWQVRQITERFNGWLLARVGMLAYLHLQEQWPHMSNKTEVAYVGEKATSIKIPEPIEAAKPTDDLPITEMKTVTIELDRFVYRRDQQSDIEHLYCGYSDQVDTLAVRMEGEGRTSIPRPSVDECADDDAYWQQILRLAFTCPICGQPKVHHRLHGYQCPNQAHWNTPARGESEQ